MEEANEFLQTYIVAHNKRFAKVPKLPGNAHVRLTENEKQLLDRTFTIQSTRTISKQLTISFQKSLYLIKNQPRPRRMIGKKVTVSESSHSEVKLYFGDTVLEYDMIKNYDFQEKVMGVRQMHEF